ncbi:MAG: L,D-transpeptidase [Chlamydiia bacterium]|nr:L,D-transpeptidase [Chlamydiia bacterium]
MGYFKRPAVVKAPDGNVQEVAIPKAMLLPKKEVRLEIRPEVKKPPPALPIASPAPSPASSGHLPDADRMKQLFATDSSQLPIVETVSYTSRAPWIKGRPAWIADYASYYNTSRHFIARSLNRKPDYFSQKVSPGDRFNVFKKGKNLEFYLLIDLSRCRMWFYYLDLDQNERVLLKTYRVGVGRIDAKRKSGFLSPIGKYSLGDKIAIYKPGTMGFFQEEKTEMMRVFGTRWIPFDQELEGCSEASKGFGLHGAPWMASGAEGSSALVEDRSKIGAYDSDGCIRLASEDIEEIFSIVITKPTTIELVKDFCDAKMPGIEKNP